MSIHTYDIQHAGIGYTENVKAIAEVLVTAIETWKASDVTRTALAEVIWSNLCMKGRGAGFDGRIKFTSDDIAEAKQYLVNDLVRGVFIENVIVEGKS